MRAIKFRVRNAKGRLLGFNRFHEGRWQCLMTMGGSGEWSSGVLHGVQIDQYTGRTDKNGTEIYEGDVVVQYLYRKDLKPMKGRGVVKYDRGSFMLAGRYEDLRHADTQRLEVIGNIYENQELIEPEAKQ
jgi:hypothetical protein